ncbi:MAG: DUF2357 domain-containing protein [Bacteroidota bacterium]|nr:DUF2357 domain-containing protein [Bacteroidota bacterium]
MPVINYEPSLRMALSGDPFFPDEKIAADFSDLSQPTELEEWQSYYVRFYGDTIPPLFSSNSFCRKAFQGNIFEVNFRNFVGLLKIGRLQLKIHNKKISNELYEVMLSELAEQYASLVFSFGTPVGQHYSKSAPGEDPAFIEYLFLKKYLLGQSPDLDAINALFLHNPHCIFKTETIRCAIQDCHTADAAIIHSIMRSPTVSLRQGHPLLQTRLGSIFNARVGSRLFPSETARVVKYETVDTNENRFIKHFMQELLRKIESLQRELVPGNGSSLNPDIQDDLNTLRQKIFHFLSLGMWQEVGPLKFIPANSQVLQKRDGYRQLFSLYSLLQLATSCDFLQTDFDHLVETKDVPTLYEYWCFFQIKNILDTISSASSIDQIINKNPLEYTLTTALKIIYKNGINLFFNKTFSGSSGVRNNDEYNDKSFSLGESFSHNLQPDIVIEINNRIIIFDAKYKGKRGGFYCEEDDGTISAWKEEDIDKMHTYRDAIKNVKGSYILFPGQKSALFPAHNSRNYFEGVSALSLRPGQEKKNNGADIARIRDVIQDFLVNF